MIRVTPKARNSRDHAGDPLDGLVNMFDVGIVLAVAFLLAALSSFHLADAFAQKGLRAIDSTTITVQPGQQTGNVPGTDDQIVGHGSKVGEVYRLSNGQLIYVTSTAVPTPAPTTTPAP